MEQRPAEHYIRVCRQRSEADWEHAPLPFKIYRNCPIIPLSSETLECLAYDHSQGFTQSLGLLLHDIYGIHRVVHFADYLDNRDYAAPNTPVSATHRYPLSLGRAVASGGALYPGEAYLLVGPNQGLAAGLYHYDPAHHALNLLRKGDLTEVLVDGLAQPPESQPGYALVLSSAFWKNAHKYQEFSYRLEALDVGCLLAQVQLVAERYGLKPALHFRYLDHAMNRLLGVNSTEESVYAIITLEAALPEATPFRSRDSARAVPHPYPGAEPPETLEQYVALSRWPLLDATHRAALIESRAEFGVLGAMPPLVPPESVDLAFELPEVKYTFSRGDVGRRHSSHPLQFRPRPLTREQLAMLLEMGLRGYRGDLEGEVPMLAHTLLYCVINHVEGIPPGIYVYDATQHLLRQIRACEVHQILQATQIGPWVNAANLSLCMIPVGNYAAGFQVYGDRWYRIQNMEAGMITQRMYLAAAAAGLGCRASLTYRDEAADALLGLPDGYTCLIQVFISPLESAAQEFGRYERFITW